MVNTHKIESKEEYLNLMSVLSNNIDYLDTTFITANYENEPIVYPCIAVITTFELDNNLIKVISFLYQRDLQ